MSRYSPRASKMLQSATICYNLLQSATICYKLLQSATICVQTSQHSATPLNAATARHATIQRPRTKCSHSQPDPKETALFRSTLGNIFEIVQMHGESFRSQGNANELFPPKESAAPSRRPLSIGWTRQRTSMTFVIVFVFLTKF